MKIAAVQLCSQDQVDENLSQVRSQVVLAARAGAELILLPEGFAYLGAERGRSGVAERLPGDGPVYRELLALAKETGAALIGGGMPESAPDPGRPYNTSVFVSPGGELLGSYRKMHLFDVDLDDGTSLKESQGSTAGDALCSVAFSGHQIGLGICYDLRFPDFFQRLREQGATVLTLPAAFTETTGRAHWRPLLQARAIETQSWVVAAAQQGVHPEGRRTYGHTMIVDPWGEVLAELGEGQGFIVADVTETAVETVRRQMPVFLHRREL